MASQPLPELVIPGSTPGFIDLDLVWPGYFNAPEYNTPPEFNAPVEPEPEPEPEPPPPPKPKPTPPADPPKPAPPRVTPEFEGPYSEDIPGVIDGWPEGIEDEFRTDEIDLILSHPDFNLLPEDDPINFRAVGPVLTGQQGFAPPVLPPALLAPTVVETGLLAGILTWLAPFIAVVMPRPTAPRWMDESPHNLEPLPELLVGGTPTRPPTRTPAPLDFLQPPNWEDLLHGYEFRYPVERFPIPLVDRERPADGVVSDPRGDTTLDPLDEVIVATPRAEPRAPSSIAPDLVSFPFEFPTGIPSELPFDEPSPQMEPERRVLPKPNVKADPYVLADPFEFVDTVPRIDVFAPPQVEPYVPVSDPVPLAPRVPAPIPGRPTVQPPISFIDPIADDPQLEAFPEPINPLSPPNKRADPCNCAKKKDKKKKKKPRQVCYRGTYREKSSSLSKTRKEIIPCQ